MLGKGYAAEAAARLLRHGFDDLGLNEVVAAVNPQNAASARVVRQLGFSVLEQIEWPKQGPVDLYALDRDAYEKRAVYQGK